jgi:hypothetical protein
LLTSGRSGVNSNSRMSSTACGVSASLSVALGRPAGGAAAVFAGAIGTTGAVGARAGAALGGVLEEAAGAGGGLTDRAVSGTRARAPSEPASSTGTRPVSPVLAAAPRNSTATFCMIVRICGVTRRSITPSPTDFLSARIIERPTKSPLGARTGRKMAMRPSSMPFSRQVCVVSVASASIASRTTVCSSGPSAPSLSHSTLASLSKRETECRRSGGKAARNCHPKDSAVTGSPAAGAAAGPVVGGRTAIAFCDCKDFPGWR